MNAAPATGKLHVELKSDSYFFGQNIPIEVRDSAMRLVERPSVKRRFSLPPGLYEVSAVLEDGRRHRALVQVKAGETAPVTLGAEVETTELKSSTGTTSRSMPRYERPRFTRKMASEEPLLARDMAAPAELFEVTGASLVGDATRSPWQFECADDVDAIPTAHFRIGDRTRLISLPISPEHGSPSHACTVTLNETSTLGFQLNAWISPERTVANALQNMMASGYVLDASEVADQAVELLGAKYQDPTGAALGGLILLKTGRLERWTSWIENLARDFDWIADGKVLLSSLLAKEGNEMGRALELAIEASRQRLLFSESFSLLLDLLRRWSKGEERDRRNQAIEEMFARTPNIDWESICLNHEEAEGP
jgi:hypothetical protein